jgi:hypothetical protein
MSAVATAGAAAWVVPEILTAKPAAGATMSGNSGGGGGTTGGGTTGGTVKPTTNPSSTTPASAGLASSTTPATTSPQTLAFTGLNIKRDAEIGAALIAGGWAMHHWASRSPKPATDAAAEGHEAGSPDDRI